MVNGLAWRIIRNKCELGLVFGIVWDRGTPIIGSPFNCFVAGFPTFAKGMDKIRPVPIGIGVWVSSIPSA